MKYLITIALSLTLMACGGGSGGSTSTTTIPSEPTVITEDHCSINNTYTEHLSARMYVFDVNECNDLASVDMSITTGRIDTAVFTDSTAIVYAQGISGSTLEARDIYSIKWLDEQENQVKYQWSENLQCYQSNIGDVLCGGDIRLDNLLTEYSYGMTAMAFNEAMKEATRIK